MLATVNLIMEKEFKVGDIVTLDRYNHIEDVETVKVVGFGETKILISSFCNIKRIIHSYFNS